MQILHIVLPLLLAALIGYITNYIAVKMLFRPYKAVKIGNKTLPFTPGVIPKNKSRIAKACGAAIAGNLFSTEDIREAVAGNIKKPDIGSVKVSDIVDEEAAESIAVLVSDKLTEGIRNADIKDVLIEKACDALEEKTKDTMLAMFVNREMIASFAQPVEQKVAQYLEQDGKTYIRLKAKEEIEKIRNRTLEQEAAELHLDLDGTVDKIFDKGIYKVISKIDIAAVVEDKINQMDVREFETLVLSVMKKELQAVVNLGALIGFVIGLVNLVI